MLLKTDAWTRSLTIKKKKGKNNPVEVTFIQMTCEVGVIISSVLFKGPLIIVMDIILS